ncbi:MAG: hypothetical protein LBR43_04115 [Spiroplasmataceae bacterium]|nr:hypothetical protein [Spiroplasmataceae bacterium]
MDISNNVRLPTWTGDLKVKFGNNKKTLEEFHFININSNLNLEEFTNLKKISYNWKIGQIILNKNLEGKITRLYPTWQELNEDERLAFIQAHPNTIYENVMKDKVIYK